MVGGLMLSYPRQDEQTIRYYDYYSNLSRGLRQKENQDALIPSTSLEIRFGLSLLTVVRLV